MLTLIQIGGVHGGVRKLQRPTLECSGCSDSGMQRMERTQYCSCRETRHCRKSASTRVQFQTQRKVSTNVIYNTPDVKSCFLLLIFDFCFLLLLLSWLLFWPRRWLCASYLSQLIATAIDHDLPTPVQRGGRSPNNEIALRISLSSIPLGIPLCYRILSASAILAGGLDL